MKKLTFILVSFIFINSYSQNNSSDYSSYSLNELVNKKTALELELNYFVVNQYLEQIERDEISHMPLTKLDHGIINRYWDAVPDLKIYYQNWKEAASEIGVFENKYAPELKGLSNQYNKKNIKKEDYYRLNREIRANILDKHPEEYKALSENLYSSLKTMWKETARYVLEDYKKQGKNFPTYWIPEQYREKITKLKNYKSINNDISLVSNEIIKKKTIKI